MINRDYYARRLEALGRDINNLRLDLVDEKAPFSAGLVRAAEESLLVVVTALRDIENVPEETL